MLTLFTLMLGASFVSVLLEAYLAGLVLMGLAYFIGSKLG